MAFKNSVNAIVKLLRSKRFFAIILGFYFFESAWIAFSALYPQAFDEGFHFGLIKIYSHYWLPFFSQQPAGANAFGAVARDPSYLYHYLMSFPYRLVALLTHSQAAQVIVFRFIDIGLFGVGLVLFRKVLLRVGVSRSLGNISILLFVLIPIVPQLAAQVSYDDLLFPLVALVCLQTFKVTDQIRQKRPSARSILVLAIICLFTSLVKYAFLPIFLTVVLFLATILYRTYRHNIRGFWASLVADFKKQSLRAKIVLPLLLVLGIGMFAQRGGVNFVRYHSVVPDCATVLSIQDCNAYNPWYYNYSSHKLVVSGVTPVVYSLKVYTKQWFYWMWYRLFFAVNGSTSSYLSYQPLPIPGAVAWMVALAGVLTIIWWIRRLLRSNPYIIFILCVCLIYSIVLFVKGYNTYKYTAVLENMNGRYLLPILPLFGAIVGLAFSYTLRKRQTQKVLAAVAVLILFLQGGGLLNFIVRSDESWYWPNRTVVKVNNAARKITSPLIRKNPKVPSSNIAPNFVD